MRLKKTERKLLIDVSKGPKHIIANKGVVNLYANMGNIPNCCSTGLLSGVGGKFFTNADKYSVTNPLKTPTMNQTTINKCKYVHQVIRKLGRTAQWVWPQEASVWLSLSLIYLKCSVGSDDNSVTPGGYSGYKAAQVAFFDRTQEDKDPKKKFKFTYNMVCSCDHAMEWLLAHPEMGELYVSPATPGGHGANVRACIFTPDLKVMKEWHDATLKLVKEHAIGMTEQYYGKNVKVQQRIDRLGAAFVAY